MKLEDQELTHVIDARTESRYLQFRYKIHKNMTFVLHTANSHFSLEIGLGN